MSDHEVKFLERGRKMIVDCESKKLSLQDVDDDYHGGRKELYHENRRFLDWDRESRQTNEVDHENVKSEIMKDNLRKRGEGSRRQGGFFSLGSLLADRRSLQPTALLES